MHTPSWLLIILLSLPAIATLLPLIPTQHWTIRIFDFPRMQIAFFGLAAIAADAIFMPSEPRWAFFAVLLANIACAGYQLYAIFQYTPLARTQVSVYQGEADERSISLLVSNVLTPNRQAHKLLALIEQWQPDIILTLETDLWWESQLESLEKSHPYCIKIPLDNLYGMHFYSRLPLRDTEIRHWVQEDIPSIRTEVCLPSGEWLRLYCLHPMPPSPTESPTSTQRDAELLLVGQEIPDCPLPVLVCGDLNDVAWSSTSRLFQKISGLLDPRIGRGLYSTFHAKWPLFRWPLDHIYHSSDFLMRHIRILPSIGSDHFPVYGSFQYQPSAQDTQEAPMRDKEDLERAQEMIDEAEPEQEIVAQKHKT